MIEARVIELKEGILGENQHDAERLRKELDEKNVFLINLMSSPGSGKTSTILSLKKYLDGKITFGVMEADIDSDKDAKTMLANGIPSIQLHTGGMCHLDADMTRQGLRALNRDDLDLIILENIGNLVCPAEYDTGATLNMTILSVPEGDDKPAKYPLMYQVCDILVINKIDTMPIFDFNLSKACEYARECNPNIKIYPISAKSGVGISELADEIIERTKTRNYEQNTSN